MREHVWRTAERAEVGGVPGRRYECLGCRFSVHIADVDPLGTPLWQSIRIQARIQFSQASALLSQEEKARRTDLHSRDLPGVQRYLDVLMGDCEEAERMFVEQVLRS